MKKRTISAFLCLCMLFSMSWMMTSCDTQNVEKDILDEESKIVFVPNEETGNEPTKNPKPIVRYEKNDNFEEALMYFSLNLFKESIYQREDDSSVMISPLSVMAALAMTANGAKGETLEEMERVLGGLDIDELNRALSNYIGSLESTEKSKLNLANSVWARDSVALRVNDSFEEEMLEFYNAALNREAFDSSTVEKINGWVSEKTDGMIESIINDIPKEAMLYLINAVCFDAKWAEPYQDYQVIDGEFVDIAGNKKQVKMLSSGEYRYIECGEGVGFIKPYEAGYSFVALLPDEGVSIYDYICSLEKEQVISSLENVSYEKVYAHLPKFSYEYEMDMKNILASLGMNSVFDFEKADLSDMAVCGDGNLAVNRVLHKTYIEVTQSGTRAAAVTSVDVLCGSAPLQEQPKEIVLDRPFVYMIIDNYANLPIFIGAVTEISE